MPVAVRQSASGTPGPPLPVDTVQSCSTKRYSSAGGQDKVLLRAEYSAFGGQVECCAKAGAHCCSTAYSIGVGQGKGYSGADGQGKGSSMARDGVISGQCAVL